MENRYDKYKDSGIAWIGEIPEHWKIIPHKRIMRKKKIIKEYYAGENILSLTKKGVIIRDLEAGGKMPTTFNGYQILYPDNLLMCLFDIDVTPRCVGVIKNEGLSSPSYSQFVLNQLGYTPFFDYLLRYMDDEKCLLHLSKNLRNSLTEDDFGQIETIVPPTQEQQSIATYLDQKCSEIDELITLQEEMITKLQSYKQSVITEAVTKGLDKNVPLKDSGIEWIGEIPEHWEISKTLFSLSMPITDGPHTTPELFETGIPFVSAEAVSFGNGRIDFSRIRGYISENFYQECCKKYVPQVDDIYMIKSGATTGRIAMVDTDVKFTIWSPLAVFRCNKERMLPRFLFYQLQSNGYQKQIELNWSYGTQQNIGMRTLEKLMLSVPSLPEQQSIATYLDQKCSEIDALISIKQQKIEKLKDYKKSLIFECVTGKRKVS